LAAAIAAAIADQGNDTDFDRRVDEQASQLGNETETKALATVLGSMRKEMRKFASPFYLEHLISEQRQLKASELELEADLQNAEAGLQGHVMESHFNPVSQGGEALLTARKVSVPAVFESNQNSMSPRSTAVRFSFVSVLAAVAMVRELM